MAHKDLRIPPELLDQIFVHLERDSGDNMIWDPIPERTRPQEFTPQSSLHPLLWVCKEWYRVAQRRLYCSVGIGSRFRSGGGGQSVLWAFYKTGRENPHLARLVRRLCLNSFVTQTTMEDAALHVLLLFLCQNIETLNISGAQQLFAEQLKTVLPVLNLVELTLSGFDSCFCTRSEFVLLLPNWPRLQRLLTFGPIFLDIDDDTILPTPSTLRGRCPDLQDISIDNECLRANHLLALSEIAPHTEKVNILVEWDANEALKPLCNWFSTLTHFRLDTYDRSSIAQICPSLRNLRTFQVRSSNVFPDALTGNFPRLELLVYFTTIEELEELADVLQEESTLPSLRDLEVKSDWEYWDREHDRELSRPAISSIESTCKRRNIEFYDSLAGWNSDAMESST